MKNPEDTPPLLLGYFPLMIVSEVRHLSTRKIHKLSCFIFELIMEIAKISIWAKSSFLILNETLIDTTSDHFDHFSMENEIVWMTLEIEGQQWLLLIAMNRLLKLNWKDSDQILAGYLCYSDGL